MSRIIQFIGLSVFMLLSIVAQAVLRQNTNFELDQITASKRAAAHTVLANGQWVKISVNQDGIYKLDAQWFQSQGIDLSNVDPRSIQLFSHQGGMLSELNASPRPNDLPENAILVLGESDGKFDVNDCVLFFAQSPDIWQYDAISKRFKHQTHFYSEKTYLFLTYGQTLGKRINVISDGMSLTPDSTFNWFNYHEFHELEKENICREGRVHFGEKFDQVNSYTFNHLLPNVLPGSKAKLFYQVASNATISTNLTVKIDGVNKDVNSFYPMLVPTNCYETNGERQFEFMPNPNFQLSFHYNKLNSSCKAWLDYYEIHAIRGLDYEESFMPFANVNSVGINTTAYQIKNMANASVIWDITNPLSPAIQSFQTIGNTAEFRVQNAGKLRQYILQDNQYKTPQFESFVSNQDLHGCGNVQFIIVSAPEFLPAANELADFHRVNDLMDVLVVTPQQIYNEFSSGSQDIVAIRDFFKHVYYKNTNPVNQLKYAMFLGDASYDYKQKLGYQSSFVPVYESDPHLGIPYPDDYYCSDDFFGYLDSLDGAWINEQKLEIAVTRVPVVTLAEANQFVLKVKHYKSAASLGPWRNSVTLCADDADNNWEKDFVNDFEAISRNLDTSFSNLNVRKVYLDAFKQQNLGGSQRYPEAQEAIKKEFEKGTLIFNYVGHGGEEYLATEKVIDIPLITSLKNMNTLPVFFTATCEFSRFDDALRKSAGEYVITQPDGGAIAMFTTNRIVYSGANAALTSFFWSNCAYVKIGGEWPRLGDVYKKLKNWYGQNSNDRKFNLFADPALRMNYPEHFIRIDSLNQADFNGNTDTLKALSKVVFKGHIENLQGQKQTGFNGTIFPVVYDKQSTFYTLGNDVSDLKLPFKLYDNILYKGSNTVKNGDYTFSFVVPKDINYNLGYGKISLYAQSATTDASGSSLKVPVGGTNTMASNDITGPDLQLFVDDYSFKSGGLTSSHPLLLAKIFDLNGVNASGSGIGRDIIATIDKNTSNEKRYVLNAFYNAELNAFTSGNIAYQLNGLSKGKHTYTLKVWDVYNNSSEATIEFLVTDDNQLQLAYVKNYPNPMQNNTHFELSHNFAGQNLDVVINVYSLSGALLKTIHKFYTQAPAVISDLQWNGSDKNDMDLPSGVYYYQALLKADNGQTTQKVEKLIKVD